MKGAGLSLRRRILPRYSHNRIWRFKQRSIVEVIIRPDAVSASQLTARIIARLIRTQWRVVLGLATGRTMESVYDLLAEYHEKENLDFSGCTSFNLDEYIGLPAGSENSYRHYMNKHLFDRVNIHLRNTHLPDVHSLDLRTACRAYDERIKAVGGIDLQLLGIGSDGHIGFNEPLSSLHSRTRDKALTPETVRQNCGMFGGDMTKVPRRAVTMGVGTILEARKIVLLATGKEKADIIAKAVEGPITSMISASALQLHPSCTIICDEDAAEKLACRDYYFWIFQNEPEWAEFR